MEDLGPYRIVRRLATGGMAEVYLARHRGLEGVERSAVIKRVHPQYASDEEFVTMFLDEARLLASLNHPHIAQVLDLGREGGSYHLVMEYVRGPTLAKLHEAARQGGARTLPLEVSLPIVLQLAEALSYLHDVHDEFGRPLRIVHRDLNPHNVIVGYNGAAKLIDFGIAKAAIRVYETRQGVIKGTYGYIAPEQLRGEPVDHRADLFSLGVLMYEMTTGELPFGPGESPDLLDRILHAQYRRPTRANPDFPAALEPLVQRCLAPSMEARLPHMRSFVDALADFMLAHRMHQTMPRLAEAVLALVPDPESSQPLVIRQVKTPSRTAPRDRAPIAGTAPLEGEFTDTAAAYSADRELSTAKRRANEPAREPAKEAGPEHTLPRANTGRATHAHVALASEPPLSDPPSEPDLSVGGAAGAAPGSAPPRWAGLVLGFVLGSVVFAGAYWLLVHAGR